MFDLPYGFRYLCLGRKLDTRLTAFSMLQYRRSIQKNGYNESFNGKLRDELLNGEIFTTLLEAKVLIEQWRNEYNQFRPHSSLNYQPHYFL